MERLVLPTDMGVKFGGIAGYTVRHGTKQKSANSSEITGGGSDFWLLDFNARYAFSANFELLPRVMYATVVDKNLGNGSSVSQFDLFYIGAGLRLLF